MGGLTVLKEIIKLLPQYHYIYLGDNARAPYGTRSFETVHEYTWECIQKLSRLDCHLIILACNTASAKALRNIQQVDLPRVSSTKRVLGVIRPVTEIVGKYTKTNKVGVLGTNGTVNSNSYKIEIAKFYPDVEVFQHACPMWVPLVENNEINSEGADYFIRKDIDKLFAKEKDIDTIILGCTHYPLLINTIKKYIPKNVQLLSQGEIVAHSLADYLNRHPDIDSLCNKSQSIEFFTTDMPTPGTDEVENFNKIGSSFFGREIKAKYIEL